MAEQPATEAIAPTIAPEETAEAKIARLEAEKIKITNERDNYRAAYLKKDRDGNDAPIDENEKISRIVDERLADSRLADIAREQQELITAVVKENKELKAAHAGKPTEFSAGAGGHSETAPVRDGVITPEQEAYFRTTLKWSDTEIARYKANLKKKV